MFIQKHNDMMTEIKEYIEKRIPELRVPQTAAFTTSLSDEIQKLAQLYEQGILSAEEFQSAKNRLIT